MGLWRRVPGDHGKRPAEAAMRHWDATASWYRNRARDPGHHMHRNACCDAGLHLLPSPPEDEWVTSLEPHHRFAVLRAGDHDLLDRLLGRRVMIGRLANIDEIHPGCQLQQVLRWRKSVIQDHVRLP